MNFSCEIFQNKLEEFSVIKYLPNALSLADPELIDATPSGLCASRPGLDGVGGVSDVSRLSICICNVMCMVLLTGILYG